MTSEARPSLREAARARETMATDKREPNKVLKLCSPSGAPPVIYQWPLILNVSF